MTMTAGALNILESCLREYRNRGFTVTEDDHVITLYHEGEEIGHWSAVWIGHGDLQEVVNELYGTCCQHWNESHNLGIEVGK